MCDYIISLKCFFVFYFMFNSLHSFSIFLVIIFFSIYFFMIFHFSIHCVAGFEWRKSHNWSRSYCSLLLFPGSCKCKYELIFIILANRSAVTDNGLNSNGWKRARLTQEKYWCTGWDFICQLSEISKIQPLFVLHEQLISSFNSNKLCFPLITEPKTEKDKWAFGNL